MVAGRHWGTISPTPARIPWRNTINSRERAPSLSASAINLTRPLCGVVSVCPTAHSSLLLLLLLRILGQSKNSSGFWDNAPSNAPSSEEEDGRGWNEEPDYSSSSFSLSLSLPSNVYLTYKEVVSERTCVIIFVLRFVQKAGWPLKMIGAEAHNYPRSKTRWLKGSLYFRLSLSFLFGGLLCIIHVADHLKVDVNNSRIWLWPVSQLKSPFINK